MDCIKSLACAVISIFAVTASAATLESMKKADVEAAFVNKTNTSIPADNLDGVDISNVFKVFMDDKGKIYGKFSKKPKDQPLTDTGVYRIADDGSMYITWEHWDGAKEICAQFFDTKNTILAVNCSNVFHTAFMKTSSEAGNKI